MMDFAVFFCFFFLNSRDFCYLFISFLAVILRRGLM